MSRKAKANAPDDAVTVDKAAPVDTTGSGQTGAAPGEGASEVGAAQAAPVPAPPPVPETTPQGREPSMAFNAIRVTGPKIGRRRAGRDFSKEPVIIMIDDLTEEEMQALMEDDKLTVVPIWVGEIVDQGQD